MFEDYMNNFNNIISSFFYIAFISILVLLVVLLVISLLLLILGCLIKSQTLKSKFLKAVPFLIIGIFFIFLMPILYLKFKRII